MPIKQEDRVLYRGLQTPDGTIIVSHNRHDFVTHTDKIDGLEYMLDGGLDYARTYGRGKIIEVRDTDDYEEVRKFFTRGSRGKKMDEELKWVPLEKMSNEHLKNVIDYCLLYGGVQYLDIYEYELEYRKDRNIIIED